MLSIPCDDLAVDRHKKRCGPQFQKRTSWGVGPCVDFASGPASINRHKQVRGAGPVLGVLRRLRRLECLSKKRKGQVASNLLLVPSSTPLSAGPRSIVAPSQAEGQGQSGQLQSSPLTHRIECSLIHRRHVDWNNRRSIRGECQRRVPREEEKRIANFFLGIYTPKKLRFAKILMGPGELAYSFGIFILTICIY